VYSRYGNYKLYSRYSYICYEISNASNKRTILTEFYAIILIQIQTKRSKILDLTAWFALVRAMRKISIAQQAIAERSKGKEKNLRN